jgi:hypothetical protein
MKGFRRDEEGSWLSDSFPRVRAFYDRGGRFWIVTAEDADGNQIGAADYCANTAGIEAAARDVACMARRLLESAYTSPLPCDLKWLGPSSDLRTNRWAATCPICRHSWVPCTTRRGAETLNCPWCGFCVILDYNGAADAKPGGV